MGDHDTAAGRGGDRYPQITKLVRDSAWAILPAAFATICDIVDRRRGGERLTDEEIRQRVGAAADRQLRTRRSGTVAVVPIAGPIVPKANLFADVSGGTSIQGLQEQLREAVGDDAVSAIVLDVDSPGGTTDLLPEMAAELRAIRGRKPIVAVANTVAASAAYWLAAQADEIVVTPSGEVGSIGVFAAHDDMSEMAAKAGVKRTFISAGRYKVEGNQYEPLGDDARDHLQTVVDEFYGMFVADVAAGRRVSTDMVLKDFGEGRMVTAHKAVAAGMADRVDTLEATVARLAAGGNQAGTNPQPMVVTYTAPVMAARTFGDDVDQALRAVDNVATGSEALRVLTGRKRDQLTVLHQRLGQLLAASAPPPAEAEDALELELAYIGLNG